MIAGLTAPFRYQGKPDADYELSAAADTSGGFPVQDRQFCW
jgi:hypothetical protein